MTLTLTDERLLAIAADGERMATEAEEHDDQRYYADVAALASAVLEVRALLTKRRVDTLIVEEVRDIIGGPDA